MYTRAQSGGTSTFYTGGSSSPSGIMLFPNPNQGTFDSVSFSTPVYVAGPKITERGQVGKKKKKRSIFISHSRADLDKLVKPAAKRIKAAGFDAYIASLRVTGKNPADKIVEAIGSSKALFAIITQNVTDDRNTRDWVLFEMGIAKSLG